MFKYLYNFQSYIGLYMYLIVGTIYFLQDVSEALTVLEQDAIVATSHPDPGSDQVHIVTPWTTITYTWTVSKAVILAWNLNKCTYNFLFILIGW